MFLKKTARTAISVLAFGFCASLALTTAHAQTFAPVPTLYFVKPFGGADPLPQVFTVASTTSTQINEAVTSVTSTGSWLSASPDNGCCISTPTSIAATVTTSAALAPGTYPGQIVITAQGGATSLTVSAMLTVTSTSAPFLDNLPGQMSFWMQPGGSAVSSQFLQVRNGGTGSMDWTLSKSTADGGNWLTTNVTSGTAPTTITVGVNVANLPSQGKVTGTYIGQLSFSGGGTTETVPIAVAVGGNLFDQVNPLNFTKLFGGANPLPQVVTVGSSANASINYVVGTTSTATGGSWLPSVDTGCCLGTPSSITVSINASPTLSVGTYTGQIVLVPQGNVGVSMVIPVYLTVAAVGSDYLDNFPGRISFSVVTNGTSIDSQYIQVRDPGPGGLDWNLTTSTADTSPWLTVSSNSGTTPSILTVGVTVANLPNAGLLPGTFIGQLVFTGNGTSVTVPVAVVVGSNVYYQVNAINFTKVFGGTNPLPQTLTIPSTTATTSLPYVVNTYTATGGSWLSSPGSTGCCLQTPSALTVTVNASPTLAVGTYTGEVVLTPQGNVGAGMIIPVTLTVAAVGSTYFDNVPGQISFSLATSAANNPPAQPIQIRNGGTGTLAWTLATSTSDGGNWLNVSAMSGTAPSTVSVSIQKAQLPNEGLVAGTFIGQLVFQTAGSEVTVPVSVSVGANVFTQVNPINFEMTQNGANPLPQILTIATTGQSNLSYVITAYTATGGNWLTSPADSGCCFGTPTTITAAVTAPATLAAGSYTGQIVLTPQGNVGVPMTIPVTLTVAPPTATYFDDVPGQMNFTLATGSTNSPPAQPIQIRNAGQGTLSWTLTTITGDGGNWLSASASSGTAPATVSVSIQTSRLPNQGLVAGTFVGELIFQTAGSVVTVPVSVSVGTNVFDQVNPINFVMPAGGANPLPQVLTVGSTNQTNLSYMIAPYTANGGNWLSSPAASGCCFGTTGTFIVAVTAPATLAAGTYTGQIVLVPQGNAGVAVTVPVTLTAAAPSGPYFDNVQGQVSFFIPTSSGNPAAQTVQIRNAGSGTLNWTVTATTSDGGNWLTTSAPSGTAPSTVSIGVVANNLPNQGLVAGAFTGQLTFTGAGETLTVPVSVEVGTNIFVEPPPLSFSMTYGGANPLSQMAQLDSTGSRLSFIVYTSSGNGGSWLSTNLGLGCCAGTPTSATATISGSKVPPGTYTGQIVEVPQGNAGVGMTVPVYLAVDNPFSLTSYSASPSGNGGADSVNVISTSQTTSWTAVSNSPFITITSGASGSGNGTVNYTVTENLSTSPRSGTITIGFYTFTVSQAGFVFSACDPQHNGAVNVADVQFIINQVLGVDSAVNDFNSDHVVDVVDLQIVINAALNLGCTG